METQQHSLNLAVSSLFLPEFPIHRFFHSTRRFKTGPITERETHYRSPIPSTDPVTNDYCFGAVVPGGRLAAGAGVGADGAAGAAIPDDTLYASTTA